MLRACALALLITFLAAGEAEPAKLPPAVQATLERLAKAEARIDADAAKARSVERQKAIKELEKAQTTATKAGDLEGAMAVKARVEELKKAEESATTDLLGENKAAGKDPAAMAVGTWALVKSKGIGGVVNLGADKTAKVVAGPYSISGTWKIEKERLVITWPIDDRSIESLAFVTPDYLVGDSYDSGKDGITLTRQKPRN